MSTLSAAASRFMHTPIKPLPPGGVSKPGHNARVATHLRATLNGLAMRVAEMHAKPTPANQAPRRGADGDYYAPNGDRLIKVQRGLSFALVNPNTNEVFYPAVRGCFGPSSGFRGPVTLPEGQRFKGGPFSAAQVAKFEAEANGRGIVFPPLRREEPIDPKVIEAARQRPVY